MKLKVYLPGVNEQNNDFFIFQPKNVKKKFKKKKEENIHYKFKNNQAENIKRYVNKDPKWSESKK